MTYEITLLMWAALLGMVHIFLGPVAAFGKAGYAKWNAGPRDLPFDMGHMAGRFERASNNFKETFVLFAVAVLVLSLAHKSSELSIWGTRLYLVSRIVYLPLYALGLAPWRSIAYGVSLMGIGLCFVTALA